MSLIRRRIKGWAFALSLVFLAAAVWLPSVIAQPIPQPGGGGTSNPALNTSQTPDTYYLSTDPLGNTLIVGEAADSGFDFAHAQATDPTFIVHSHNQNTGQWISLSHNATNGIADVGTGALVLSSGGTDRGAFGNDFLKLRTTTLFGWTNGTATGSHDTILGRETIATIQMGSDVNGSPVNQTFKAHDGITGTDIAGANLTFAAGRGTGAGAGGNLSLQTAYTLGTGTTAQTLADREVVVAKPKALTAAAATAFVQIAVPQGTVAGGTIEYTIRANDATNYQARSGVLVYSAVNPAGTEVCTLSRPDGGATVDNTTDSVAVSSGTLTNTFTCTVGLTDVVQIAANAASSLTETVLQISYVVRKNEGSGAITPQ